MWNNRLRMPSPSEALPGREQRIPAPDHHFVSGAPLHPPFSSGIETALFGLGCFWGAERRFWLLKGVFSTAVGYAGGFTPNPTYHEVCSGLTGHAEVVLVAFDPRVVSYEHLLRVFWENHDPTQGMRQGNDVGTQYRSVILYRDAVQQAAATASKHVYQKVLFDSGWGRITTQIVEAGPFYYAEEHHQQYLARNPAGYCGLGGTGVACPAGFQDFAAVSVR